MESFDKILAESNCSIFFLQETKLRRQGTIKSPNSQNYVIFELLRKQKCGGGLAIGVAKELNPIWISEGNDEIEFLTVQVNLKGISIRCVNGYGPQENEQNEKKMNFWASLDNEVENADFEGFGFILQMDGNLWAGPNIIPGDPNPKNKMVKCLLNFYSAILN